MDLDMKIDDKAAKVLFHQSRRQSPGLGLAHAQNSLPALQLHPGELRRRGALQHAWLHYGRPQQVGENQETAALQRRKSQGGKRGLPWCGPGTCKRAITEDSDDGSAWVTASMVYARIHNFGGKTEPHEIKARNGKTLAFSIEGKSILRKSVHHPGSDIPARPFMVIQDEDLEYARDTLLDHLTGIA